MMDVSMDKKWTTNRIYTGKILFDISRHLSIEVSLENGRN